MSYHDKYKKKGTLYRDERSLRAAIKEKERRESRHKNFSTRRNIDEDILKLNVEDTTRNVKGKMGLRLLQWKQKKERERQEAMEKKKKKPPFVVGIVRHKMVPQFPSPVNSGRHNQSIKAPPTVGPILMSPSSNKPLRRSARLSSKNVEALEKKTSQRSKFSKILPAKVVEVSEGKRSQKSKISRAPNISKILPSIEECENEDNNKRNQENCARSGDQHEIIKEADKSGVLSHPMIFADSFSPFLSRKRGKDQHKSPAKKADTPIRSRGDQHEIIKEADKSGVLSHPMIFADSFSPFLSRKRGKDQHKSPAKKADTPIRSRGDRHEESKEEDKSNLLSHPVIFAASLSPFICKERGKDRHQSPTKKPETPIRNRESGGLRKHIAKKIIEEKLSDCLEIEKEEKWSLTKENFFAPSPSEDQNITSFRNLYSNEMKRLGSLCLDWDASSQEIPTEVQDSVRSTVCQARLLMREKLAQFKELVDRSASCGPSTQCKVTHSDLQGFWDLVSIQIEDINNKFKKLDDLKGNNWVEIVEEESVPKKRTRKVNKEPMKTKKPNVEKKSAFRLFLLEQKKKLEVAVDQVPEMILTPSNKTPKPRRKSTRSSGAENKEGKSPAVGSIRRVTLKGDSAAAVGTPRRVTFKGLDENTETPRMKLPRTPHIIKVSCETPKSCTPTSKRRRSRRLTGDDFDSYDEG